tara:strand:- start:310 stop:609 length:300 start_codon:yes stop_codon:yes gene_type:complete
MALNNDRSNIFPGVKVSHRGKTITDTGSSKQYIDFLNSISESKDSKIAIVPNELEGRPDLIAYAAYGNENLWWLIVEANQAYDYEVDFKSGKQILIPNI